MQQNGEHALMSNTATARIRKQVVAWQRDTNPAIGYFLFHVSQACVHREETDSHTFAPAVGEERVGGCENQKDAPCTRMEPSRRTSTILPIPQESQRLPVGHFYGAFHGAFYTNAPSTYVCLSPSRQLGRYKAIGGKRSSKHLLFM